MAFAGLCRIYELQAFLTELVSNFHFDLSEDVGRIRKANATVTSFTLMFIWFTSTSCAVASYDCCLVILPTKAAASRTLENGATPFSCTT